MHSIISELLKFVTLLNIELISETPTSPGSSSDLTASKTLDNII